MSATTIAYNDTARLNFRLTLEAKDLVERAALASGLTVTDFAITSLLESAHEVLARQEQRRLSDRDRDVFLTFLDNPPGPNEALKKAALRYKKIKKSKARK